MEKLLKEVNDIAGVIKNAGTEEMDVIEKRLVKLQAFIRKLPFTKFNSSLHKSATILGCTLCYVYVKMFRISRKKSKKLSTLKFCGTILHNTLERVLSLRRDDFKDLLKQYFGVLNSTKIPKSIVDVNYLLYCAYVATVSKDYATVGVIISYLETFDVTYLLPSNVTSVDFTFLELPSEIGSVVFALKCVLKLQRDDLEMDLTALSGKFSLGYNLMLSYKFAFGKDSDYHHPLFETPLTDAQYFINCLNANNCYLLGFPHRAIHICHDIIEKASCILLPLWICARSLRIIGSLDEELLMLEQISLLDEDDFYRSKDPLTNLILAKQHDLSFYPSNFRIQFAICRCLMEMGHYERASLSLQKLEQSVKGSFDELCDEFVLPTIYLARVICRTQHRIEDGLAMVDRLLHACSANNYFIRACAKLVRSRMLCSVTALEDIEEATSCCRKMKDSLLKLDYELLMALCLQQHARVLHNDYYNDKLALVYSRMSIQLSECPYLAKFHYDILKKAGGMENAQEYWEDWQKRTHFQSISNYFLIDIVASGQMN